MPGSSIECMPTFTPATHLSLAGAATGARRGALPVLVVDDEPTIRTVVRRALTSDGWTVAEAADGPAALALLLDPTRDWAAVLLDLSLPGLPGESVHARLRTERPSLLPRVILCSGLPSALGDSPDAAVLAKPFEVSTLRAVVRRVASARVEA